MRILRVIGIFSCLFVWCFYAGPWVSCGEWCLTKTSGFCPQIHATSRRNGTDIQLENCTRITTTTCPEVSIVVFLCLPLNKCTICTCNLKVKCAHSARSACTVQRIDAFELFSTFFSHFLMFCIVDQVKKDIFKSKYNCNNGTECALLTGLFDCSLGKYGFLFIQLCTRSIVWLSECVCVHSIYITLCTTICHLHNGKMKMDKNGEWSRKRMDLWMNEWNRTWMHANRIHLISTCFCLFFFYCY